MTLRQIVEKYLAIAGGFGFLAPLADFGLQRNDTERVLHFSQVSGTAYSIDGFEQTHVTIDAEIESIL